MSHIIAFLLGVNFATNESSTVVNTLFYFLMKNKKKDLTNFIKYNII